MAERSPEQDERLADWVDGRLSDRDRERLEAEFGVNPELRAAAERYRLAVTKVRSELQAQGEGVDLSDKIMARLAGGADLQPSRRRLFPFMASVAAAAAIFMTYFALQHMPEFVDDVSPASGTKLAAEPKQLDEADRFQADRPLSADRDDAPLGAVRLGARKKAELPQAAAIDAKEFAKAEDQEAPSSIEQVLRDALKAGADKDFDLDQSRVAGLSASELVLVIEMPQAGFANLRAEVGAARAADPTTPGAAGSVSLALESRSRQLEKNKSEVAQNSWRQVANEFMQQPLLQPEFRGLITPPTVQGGYLDAIPDGRARSARATGKARADGETFAPLPEDIYFSVEGSEEQILAYLRELRRLTEQGQGRVLSQWTSPGVNLGLPQESLLVGGRLASPNEVASKNDLLRPETEATGQASQSVARKVNAPGQLPADRFGAQSRRRQHFVLRQRR